MCTMCIEYRFALLGNTAKGLFFSISLCIRWMARKRKRGFSFFLMAKLFEGNSFHTRVYMREEHFFRFHFQRRGALFRAFKYFRHKAMKNKKNGKSHLKSWPYCIVSDSLLFVNTLCFFCAWLLHVYYTTQQHTIYILIRSTSWSA